jgi:hypothetical protein
MIIFCAKMTPETSKMEEFGGDIIPFSIPMILTGILLTRNKIRLDISKLIRLLLIFAIWSAIVIVKIGSYNFENFTLYLFLLYSVIIAFCQIGVYGEKLFPLYEDIMVKISLLSICLWIPFCLLMPSLGETIFSLFPKSFTGFNFLYLFNWTELGESGRLRNSGCAWEPGYFALMIAFAIYINLRENGLKFRNNKKLLILVIAMITTTSTTGYVVMLVEFFMFYVKRLSLKTILGTAVFFVPLIYYGAQLEFIGDKISTSMEGSTDISALETYLTWGEMESEGKIAIDRIPSAIIQIENLKHDPIFGYGLNDYNSYFFKYNNITHMAYCGGFVQTFSQYGILLGIFLLYLLFTTSKKLNNLSKEHNFDFFVICLLLSISYPIFRCSVFTAFWLFGYIYSPRLKPNNKIIK